MLKPEAEKNKWMILLYQVSLISLKIKLSFIYFIKKLIKKSQIYDIFKINFINK